ncbi:MAG: F0F1 ATP synthase subunit B [Magnetococcales bacterium]|nr:F0F1 ATP synthase subunit B [Magnetococcales bacterium]
MISVAHAAAEHAQSSGLPQFDASKFSSEIFWAVVSFVLLMALMKKYVLPAINDILDARGKSIADDLDSARKQRQEAEKMLEDYRKTLATARDSAAKIMEQTQKEAIAHRENALKDLEAELTRRQEMALLEISQAKNKALEEIREAAVDVAMLATEKLIGKAVTKTDANKMVEDAIVQLKEHGDRIH